MQRKEIKPRVVTVKLVLNQRGKVKTTSLIVAKVFERRHDNVMASIREIVNSDVYQKRHQLNFQLMSRLVDIGNNAKRKEDYYEMDRQGFEILAMGFTGQKALEWKFKYSDAFAAMEEALKRERVVIQDNPFNLEDLGLGLLQVGYEQRQAQKQVRNRWVNVLRNSIGCGNIWVRRLTNEVYQILLDNKDATASNFRQHMNLPSVSAIHLTRDQLEGHIQSFVADIELSSIRLYSLNREITFNELRDFMHNQARTYYQQLLRIVNSQPVELVFHHDYNVVPMLHYRQCRDLISSS